MSKVWVLSLIARTKENDVKPVNNDGKRRNVLNRIVYTNKIDELDTDIAILKSIGELTIPNFSECVWRAYVSVNSRDIRKTNKMLIGKIIDSAYDNIDVHVNNIYKKILMKENHRADKLMLIDIDSTDASVISLVLFRLSGVTKIHHDLSRATPNGQHLVVDGFDVRILDDISSVEVKRNALVFLKMI